MLKILAACILVVISLDAHTQTIKNLEWWKSRQLLASFPYDIDTLYNLITSNTDLILDLKRDFDSSKSDRSQRERFRVRILKDSERIQNNIDSVTKRGFYYNATTKKDTSFLYYYIHRELNNYLATLSALSTEAKYLITGNNTMDVFNTSNFLNAYYNVSIGRSLLLAAMSNTERYFLIGSVADSISRTSLKVDTIVSMVKDTLHKVDSVGMHSDTLLKNPFKPYKTLKNTKQLNSSPTDKISTASNTILIDNRKNWWWRTLVGGVIGGLVAGLVVTAAQ